MADTIEVSICCDALDEAIEGGGIQIIDHEGQTIEVIADEDGKSATQINYCPFCGEPRHEEAAGDSPNAFVNGVA